MVVVSLVFIVSAGCVTIHVNAPVFSSAQLPAAAENVTGTPPSSERYSSGVLDNESAARDPDTNLSPAKTMSPVSRITANPNSKSDVNRRFQDVVFGNEAQYLNRWENRNVKLGVAGEYTREDLKTLHDFVIRFNNVSDTTHLTLPYESENQEFTIRFVPPSFFSTIDEDVADKVVRNTDTGEVYFADVTNKNSWVETDLIYINSRFKGEERKYLLLRALLYDMGFEGYSDDPASIFYFNPRTTELSEMDWAVIDLLYSKKFTYGESLSSVRAKLT
ncbi:DUF2927 domain-containing protein [Methanoregula sp.]|uniref:DUF2927 domain-containing protein n=1 Tax=Methanoregula sp. TaxID=2052170 RepID=UPI000CB111E4|nr:DUF2927 domain-containing protein [Methanoregula sp.]PKG32755.1 MAG: hypothetical protein CW742_06510 [Methanoregula sp.]